jgi:hypothetical protein
MRVRQKAQQPQTLDPHPPKRVRNLTGPSPGMLKSPLEQHELCQNMIPPPELPPPAPEQPPLPMSILELPLEWPKSHHLEPQLQPTGFLPAE